MFNTISTDKDIFDVFMGRDRYMYILIWAPDLERYFVLRVRDFERININ